MAHIPRIGTQIWPDDPFWVQVREAIQQYAQQLGVELVAIDSENLERLTLADQERLVEELLTFDLDALLGWSIDDALVFRALDAGLPVVHLGESAVRHPRFASPLGLHDSAVLLGQFLVEQLRSAGQVLVVGGQQGYGEDGQSRIAGFREVFAAHPAIEVQFVPAPWRYEAAYPQLLRHFQQGNAAPAALIGLSDSLALASRDAARACGLLSNTTLVGGINGDPLALAAVAEGSMTATVQTPAFAFGLQALQIATRAAQGMAIPPHFSYNPRLITAQQVGEVAAQQLHALASLPSRLVGFNRQQEQQRMVQLQTSLEINRRAGLILDRQRLAHVIADLIRANYGYDKVVLLWWDAQQQRLWLEQPDQHAPHGPAVALASNPVLRAAIERNEPIFVPDMRHSHRFQREEQHADTRARVVLPIRLGGQISGLLDLHSYQVARHTHQELLGLQTLADQLGIAMRNAELYGQAVEARARAEYTDQLKTRTLAHVSHELRAPLRLILEYSQAALDAPQRQGNEIAPALQRELQQIYRSGKHLIRLIDDLLDLSRAEIGELDLFPETIAVRVFLEAAFRSVVEEGNQKGLVQWRLEVPERLPVIRGDPLRLQQAISHLLQQARKYTTSGQIVLGAEVQAPHLHIWIADSGPGIALEVQEQLFESFTTMKNGHEHDGSGPGLALTRQLITLHGGSMTLESQPGVGSTFHIYLPLPRLSGQAISVTTTSRPALLVIAAQHEADATIQAIAQRQGLAIRRLQMSDDLPSALIEVQPVALAWNLAQAGSADWELFQQVRGQPRLFQLPVILYHHGPEDTSDSNLGITSVVLKPLAHAKLLDSIRRVLPNDDAGPILIIDSNEQAHELYQRLIAEYLPGYAVHGATSGAEGLHLLAQELPSLVILDLEVSESDGFVLIEHIRASPQTRDVPILVVSEHSLDFEDMQRLNQARVTYHGKDLLTDTEAADVLWRVLSQNDALPPHTSTLVKHAVVYMQQQYQQTLSRQELANAIGVNPDYLTRIFRRELGISPWDYLNRYRIKQARLLLRTTHLNIAAIAAQVGFSDPAYFSRVFHKEVGCSPRIFRERP
jgi:signal transduction histidine kinase/AraC-like DNA-binding protein/ABC-type sugar transport system substrate-binding protein